jgi:hypothetical protein
MVRQFATAPFAGSSFLHTLAAPAASHVRGGHEHPTSSGCQGETEVNVTSEVQGPHWPPEHVFLPGEHMTYPPLA